MKTVDKDTKTHYVTYLEMFAGGVKFLDQFDDGDIVIVNYSSGLSKTYVVSTVKRLTEL